jgi:hypothetical protein
VVGEREGDMDSTRGAGGVVGATLTAVRRSPNPKREGEPRIKGGQRQTPTDLGH